MKKVLIVAGARPNFMKAAPIVRALQRRSDLFAYQLVHTGQHYDREMSDVFFEELDIPKPDHRLEVGSGTHAEQTAKIMLRFEPVCQNERPDIVIVVGDVNSTLACALVAKKLNRNVAHVEAGLRSRDLTMPEEINRIATDAISDYFFVTEQSGAQNLRAEGKPDTAIFHVGHVMIDNLFYQIEKLDRLHSDLIAGDERDGLPPEYGVVTLHRPSNVDDYDTLARILGAMASISQKLPLVFPVHPRTQASLSRFGMQLPKEVMALGPQSYMAFLRLFRKARIVLTDSGGLQEETTALGIPCLTLRDNTERPITVQQGTNVLVGSAPDRIVAEAEKILRGEGKVGLRPPLWDGRAAERSVDALAAQL